ncbi:MAG TPA: VWA domain-containing protein [Polyangiaceae bacterium]|nr:VWA domain-containing protein [Polyangiaceae bacterium]
MSGGRERFARVARGFAARGSRAWLGALAIAVFAAGLWVYLRYVWYAGATLTWSRHASEYQLLAPRMLGIALLAPYFLWVVGRSLADLPPAQRAISVLLRIGFVALIALGLARLARTATTQKVCTVYLVDVSDSISDAGLEDARAEVQKGVDARGKDDLVRLVTFARRPRAVPLGDETGGITGGRSTIAVPPIERHGPGLGAGTDLASAMQLAYGLYREGYLRRAVILSDGVQTDGDVLAEANRAKLYGVKVFAVPSKRPVPGEVAVRELRVPDKVREEETFDLHAQVFSSVAQKVKLSLKQGDVINGLDGVKVVDLQPGDNDVVFKSRAAVPGEVTYSLDVSDAAEDHFAENNKATAVAAVVGMPVVLYVDGNPSRASYLSAALSAQQLNVDTFDPLPTSLREAEKYDFIILSDMPAEKVSLTQQDTIEQYVRDLGGGFLFAGGENGYGLGGWYHTTIERILPVRMDAEKRRDEPEVAMALVIDRSGSMQGLPLEMAKQAAKATADTLAADDLLEVIAFDSQPTRIVRMTPAKHSARIQSDIARIQAGGGTEIFSALDTAYQALSTTRAKRKHVVLLTDGQAPQNGIRDLVQAMAAEEITVTTVGLGGGVDESLLRMVSDVGGGRFYKVLDPQSLPRIFTRETEMVSRSAAVEEYFQPRVSAPADFLRGIDIAGAPFLHGYIATKLKPPPAQQILESELGEPILARWRVGLGYSLAWTSDVKNLWAVEWLRWPQWGQFWSQLVREHMRQKKRQVFDMRAEVDAATGRVRATIDAVGNDDAFQNGLDATLTVTGPEGSGGGATARSETRKVPMPQVAPGRYEADFPLDRYGSFLLHATLEQSVDEGHGKGGKTATVAESFGHVTNSYPREYLALAPDVDTLARAAAVTGGKLDPDPAAVFDPAGEVIRYHEDMWPRFVGAAIALFLLDLLVRRVRLFDRKRTSKARGGSVPGSGGSSGRGTGRVARHAN